MPGNHPLQEPVERYYAAGAASASDPAAMTTFLELRAALEAGEIRAASPDPSSPSGWRVNAWVKRGILLGFRLGALTEMPQARPEAKSGPGDTPLSFVDKNTYPTRSFSARDGVRLVPGGSSV